MSSENEVIEIFAKMKYSTRFLIYSAAIMRAGKPMTNLLHIGGDER